MFFFALVGLIIPAAWAISLYDIIQLTKKGYRDDQIISIIEATGSRFETDADTILTLKREGVREKVIQAVIAASDGPPAQDRQPAAATEDRWRTAAVDERQPDDHDRAQPHRDDAARPGTEISVVAPSSARSGGRLLFSAFPYEEAASGHHQHYVIALGDVPVVILRSEAGFRTVAERARSAVEALNRLQSNGSSLLGSHDAVRAQSANGASVDVLKIDRGDVIGLQRRSAGRIVPERIGSYWAALLGDYLDLASGREPRRLTMSGIESVRTLYRELTRGAAKSTSMSSDGLRAAIDRLPGEDREALIDLAGYVPAQFHSTEEKQ